MPLVVAFDFECPGGVIGVNGFTQLGAAIVDESTETVVATWSAYANIANLAWEERCVNEFWVNRPARLANTICKCQASAMSCGDVVVAFLAWVRAHTAGKDAYFLTDNAAYGAALLRAFAREDVFYAIARMDGVPMYRPIQDVNCFYRGAASVSRGSLALDGTSELDAKSMLLDDLGIELPDYGVPHDHSPERDAEKMARDFCYIRKALDVRKTKL